MSSAEDPVPYRVKYTEQRKEQAKVRAKEQRRSRQEANSCPDCGKPKDTAGYRCIECKKAHTLARGKERRAEHKASGLCVLCSNSAAPGFTKCLAHLEASRSYRAKFDCGQKEKGLCTQCTKPAAEGSILCPYHIRKRVALAEKGRELTAQGTCYICRENPIVEGRRECQGCRETQSARHKIRKAEKEKQGLCTTCSSPRLAHGKVCRECYLKRVASQNGLTSAGWVDLLELYEKQNGVCAYSGETLVFGDNSSLDHITPVSAGGTSELSNLQWTTKTVNQIKRDLSEDEFLRLVNLIYHFKLIKSEGM